MIWNRKGYESYLLISSNSTATLVSNFPLINSLFLTSIVSIFFPNFRLLRLLIFFQVYWLLLQCKVLFRARQRYSLHSWRNTCFTYNITGLFLTAWNSQVLYHSKRNNHKNGRTGKEAIRERVEEKSRVKLYMKLDTGKLCPRKNQ